MNTASHSNKRSTYLTQGNLALTPATQQDFTLIEGGRSRTASVQSRNLDRAQQVQTFQMKMMALLTFVVFVAVLAISSVASDALINSRHGQISDVPTTSVIVKGGDCLLSLAEEHPVSGHTPDEVVSWRHEANDLDTATLLVGQHLIVPAVEG
ncbi:MAG: hypothetical protein IJ092_03250 [Atopobiaceae bacterium]|nr:hypothetical protein [Atopobiaceae bacterium]